MNKREFMKAVIAAELNEEVTEFATAAIAKMDMENSKRKAKAAEKAEANMVFINQFVDFLGEEALTASDIAAKFEEAGVEREDGKAVNVQWISSLGRKAVEMGLASKTDVKVKGKGTQKGYVVA